MSEPTGDAPPSNLSPRGDLPGPPATEALDLPSGTPAPLTPLPRANPPNIFNPKDVPSAAPSGPPGASEFLAWVQAFTGAQSAPGPENSPGQRALLSKEQKKFHRATPEALKAEGKIAAPERAANQINDEEDAASGRPEPPLRTGTPIRTPVVRKRRQQQAGAVRSRSYKPLLWGLIAILSFVGFFVLGRATVPKIVPSNLPPATRAIPMQGEQSTRIAKLIDQAMTAEARSDFDQAASLLGQAQAEKAHVPGIDYHLALLAFESGQMPRAMSLLDHSIDEGEELAACFNLRGLLANRAQGMVRGLESFETATQLDPYNAKYFFYLGEALRRAGKPQAALVRLEQAIDRLREPELDSLYRLKMRLTQIELGQETTFAKQLDDELRQNPPSIDWLFTAAAVEMHRGHFAAAAEFLDKVLTLANQQQVEVRLRDYFFYGFAHEKLLSRFFVAPMPGGALPAPAAPVAAPPSAPENAPSPKNVPASPAPGTSPEP